MSDDKTRRTRMGEEEVIKLIRDQWIDTLTKNEIARLKPETADLSHLLPYIRLTPRLDLIVVLRREAKISSQIILSDQARYNMKRMEGTVITIGEGVDTEINIGDKIIWGIGAGKDLVAKEAIFTVMSEVDMYGRLDGGFIYGRK